MNKITNHMKNIASILCVLFLVGTHAYAQNTMSFQGKLIEDGTAVTGSRDFQFSIPDVSWSESHTGVNVVDGLYSVVLGSNTPLPVLFDGASERQLLISVDGNVLTPVTINAPYANKVFNDSQDLAADSEMFAVKGEASGTGADGFTSVYSGVLGVGSAEVGDNAGVRGVVDIANGNTNPGFSKGVQGTITSAEPTATGYAIRGDLSGQYGFASAVRGFSSNTVAPSGELGNNVGGFFSAVDNPFRNIGVVGDARGDDNAASENIGVSGETRTVNSVRNVGTQGLAFDSPETNIGVYGTASGPEGSNSFAGYFDGNVSVDGAFGLWNPDVFNTFSNTQGDWRILNVSNFFTPNNENGLIMVFGPRDDGEGRRAMLGSWGTNSADSYGYLELAGYQGNPFVKLTAENQYGSLKLNESNGNETVSIDGSTGTITLTSPDGQSDFTIDPSGVQIDNANFVNDGNLAASEELNAATGTVTGTGPGSTDSNSALFNGLKGESTASGGWSTGVYGQANVVAGTEGFTNGVRGVAVGDDDPNAVVYGVRGEIAGSFGFSSGVRGLANNTNPNNRSIGGDFSAAGNPSENRGVWGRTSGDGTAGSVNIGVYGQSLSGNSSENIGVYGTAGNSTGPNWAGKFDGDIQLNGNPQFNGDRIALGKKEWENNPELPYFALRSSEEQTDTNNTDCDDPDTQEIEFCTFFPDMVWIDVEDDGQGNQRGVININSTNGNSFRIDSDGISGGNTQNLSVNAPDDSQIFSVNPNGVDPDGEGPNEPGAPYAGEMFLWGNNTPNVQIGAPVWEGASGAGRSFINMYGNASDGGGWYRSYVNVGVNDYGSGEFGSISLQGPNSPNFEISAQGDNSDKPYFNMMGSVQTEFTNDNGTPGDPNDDFQDFYYNNLVNFEVQDDGNGGELGVMHLRGTNGSEFRLDANGLGNASFEQLNVNGPDGSGNVAINGHGTGQNHGLIHLYGSFDDTNDNLRAGVQVNDDGAGNSWGNFFLNGPVFENGGSRNFVELNVNGDVTNGWAGTFNMNGNSSPNFEFGAKTWEGGSGADRPYFNMRGSVQTEFTNDNGTPGDPNDDFQDFYYQELVNFDVQDDGNSGELGVLHLRATDGSELRLDPSGFNTNGNGSFAQNKINLSKSQREIYDENGPTGNFFDVGEITVGDNAFGNGIVMTDEAGGQINWNSGDQNRVNITGDDAIRVNGGPNGQTKVHITQGDNGSTGVTTGRIEVFGPDDVGPEVELGSIAGSPGGRLYISQMAATHRRSAVRMGPFGEGQAFFQMFGENTSLDGDNVMVDMYITDRAFGSPNPYANNYKRAGVDFRDNEGRTLSLLGSGRDESNTMNPNTSGLSLLFGQDGINAEITGKNWENSELPIFNMFGQTGDGNGWRLPNSTVGINSDGTDDWATIDLNRTNISMGSSTNTVSINGQNGDASFAGQVTVGSFIDQSSDRRLKVEITTLNNALNNVSRMRGVSYFWKDKMKGERKQIGVIAQEVEEIYPEFVRTNEEGMKSVNYSQMVAVLIESIKELNAKITVLETENTELKASLETAEANTQRIETLNAQMNSLQQLINQLVPKPQTESNHEVKVSEQQ